MTRITPAYAGNTNVNIQSRHVPKDHPRVCGKYFQDWGFNAAGLGSPPRMREIRISHVLHAAFHEDHPRVCGKYSPISAQDADELRITPAYAGNTSFETFVTSIPAGSPPRMREIPALKPLLHLYQRDHPRVCGKYNISLYNCVPTPGSPPRMRVKHTCERCDRHAFGITPAYAGKTEHVQDYQGVY